MYRLVDERGAGGLAQPSAGTATTWLPHPSRFLRRLGSSADCTIGSAFHAAGAHSEISPQPSPLIETIEIH